MFASSKYSNQRREETGREAKSPLGWRGADLSLCWASLVFRALLRDQIRFNGREKTLEEEKRKKKTGRAQAWDEHEEARSEADTSEPIPSSQPTRSCSSRQPPRHAPEQRRRESRPPARRWAARAIRLRLVPVPLPPANPNCSPLGGQLNSCCFSDSIRLHRARRLPRRRSSRYELAWGRGSCPHCSRVWVGNPIGSPGPRPLCLIRACRAAPWDLAAVGAAPAVMRSPPWPASWELGYGLALCRKRRKP
jgi:hypothetical protein